MLIAGSVAWRTTRAPCKPRDVVIVQGFQGHFANPWPPADRICDASAAPKKFRKNILMHAFDALAA
jgi:hypothetical protein